MPPKKKHSRVFLGRKGIVYTITPFGIIKTKPPKKESACPSAPKPRNLEADGTGGCTGFLRHQQKNTRTQGPSDTGTSRKCCRLRRVRFADDADKVDLEREPVPEPVFFYEPLGYDNRLFWAMRADGWGESGSSGEHGDEEGVDEVLAARFTAAADIGGGGGTGGAGAARQQDNENKGQCQGQCQAQAQQAKRKSKKAHENGNGNPNAAGIPPQTQTQRGPSQCPCPGPANNPNLRPSIRPYVDGHHQSCFSPSPREREYYDDGVDLIPFSASDTTTVSIPFSTAARKLQATLSRSIAFFKTFYRDFRAETRGLGGYADTQLMNRAWRRKIRNSEEYIGPVNNRWSRLGQDEGPSAAAPARNNPSTTSNNNDSGNHGGNNNNHERMWAAAATQPDLRTFSELQREVIDRVTALYHAKLPQARLLRRPTDRHSYNLSGLEFGEEEEMLGEEDGGNGNATDRRILEDWNSALTLKRHVRDSFGRVVRAVKDMDKNYMAVTQAMRELDMLRRDLVIYRRGWDERVCCQGVSTNDGGGGGEWDGDSGDDELGVGGGHEDQGAPEEGGQDDQGEQK
ncbi:hypothetical protein ABEF93_000029 [Exophiala dermatitidis]